MNEKLIIRYSLNVGKYTVCVFVSICVCVCLKLTHSLICHSLFLLVVLCSAQPSMDPYGFAMEGSHFLVISNLLSLSVRPLLSMKLWQRVCMVIIII